MKKNWLAVLFCSGFISANAQYSWGNLPKVEEPVFKTDTFSILNYGGKSDGYTLNTRAISAAIIDCSRQGGGVVMIPAGLWLSGPIEMRSNVNLHLASGALLTFTTDKTKYPLVEGFYEGKRAARNQSPISGTGLTNIAITGKGVIDGNGDAWRAVGKSALTENEWKEKIRSGGVLKDDGKEWYPSEQFKQAKVENKSMLLVPGKELKDFEEMKDFLRPNLVVFTQCNKVLLEGVTLQNSAAWCIHPLMCENLILRDLLVKNPAYAQNGDGADIESCKFFLVEGCTFDVGDDAICIKSGKDEEGRKRGMPTQYGIVRNNLVYKAHGGFVIGSEMSGGANNIFVYDCNFMGTDKGLRFKSTRGRGGVVEKIYARNIYMKDIEQEAIFFDMYYFVKFATDGERNESPVVNEGTPIFRDMHFEKIVCNGAKKGIFIRGLPEMPVQNIRFTDCILTAEIGAELVDVDRIAFDMQELNPTKTDPVISINNGTNVRFGGLIFPSAFKTILKVTGERSKDIDMSHMGITKDSERIVITDGAPATAVLMD
ncbi:glycoside hydrolase family 28 protein [Terrimonas sp. NA20]|uniref:Glycoside hydrolase family 28 protein n=1 Tax=Terrimonas ginsenosidimutans TaxID=2908004 RepID=A0ABS9KNB8_9BACT|nr:glycoside hydrolase family 28 protein [Terrimonas ginsenosidimutans]MCG2613817.1 glycoside hydrolase family 28 protein [Terrimonas ginsenosidimutans]